MTMKPTLALFLLMAAMPVNAKPKPFYKRWQTYVGSAIIIGANIADAHESCTHAGVEPRLGRGCNTAIGINLANAAFGTTLFMWEQHHGRNADWKPEIFLRDWSMPMIEGSIMGYAAWHDSQRPVLPKFQPVIHDTAIAGVGQ